MVRNAASWRITRLADERARTHTHGFASTDASASQLALSVHERPGFATVIAGLGVRCAARPLSVSVPANAWGVALLNATLSAGLPIVSHPHGTAEVSPVRADFDGGAVVGEWVRAPGVEPSGPALLYIHGGAFVACSPRTHRGLTSELSAQSGLPVFAVEYRKAPRYRFPAANDDAWRAYRWLSSRTGGGLVAIAGDSAGGYLAVATALAATRGAGRGDCPPPAALLALSPLTDATLSLARMRERGRLQEDPFVSAAAATRIVGLYTAGASAQEISLLDADFRNFCPTMIHVGGTEMLLEDARALHTRVRAAGGASWLHIWPGQVHVFPAMFRFVPQARAALSLSGAFLRDAISPEAARAAVHRPPDTG
ncbi:alpha/beta hydrolase [Nocardia wallacei]|uniref:alpha/beta hydrolase n=1 Tax=Nocardia wallacei TaxID=480035 RepID=UPI002458B576|nr:alpha/beta hydrolase [Nocardia wallacei]